MTTNWETLSVDEIEELCGTGDGDRIGLPSVPPLLVDINVTVARALISSIVEEDGILADLASVRCSECDQCPDAVGTANQHTMAGAYVLIGCEGYHTPLFRAIYASRNDD